jgi:hypothetical protein
VAEHVGDHPDGHAEREQRGRRGVPGVVQPDDADASVAEQCPPGLPVAVLVQRTAVRLCEDQIAVLPPVASAQPLGELRGPVGPQ